MATDPVVAYGVNAYCEVSQITTAFGGFTLPTPATQWTDNSNRELHRMIVDASQRIDAITGQYFGRMAASLELDGNGTEYLPFGHLLAVPLYSATQLQYREEFTKTYDWDASSEVVDEDSYDIADDRMGLVRIASGRAGNAREGGWYAGAFTRGRKNYRLSGVFGRYDEVPQNIETACIILCRDTIKPGWAERHEKFLSEKFQDGYSYSRASSVSESTTPIYTGILVVDAILANYIDDSPRLGIIK